MKKIIPISLFILVTFGSCETLDVLNELLDAISDEPQQTYYIPDSFKPLFKVNDTFYYYSTQTKLTDTLVINYKEQGFEEGEGDKKTADIFEFIHVTYQFVNKKDTRIFYSQEIWDCPTICCGIGSSRIEYIKYYLIEIENEEFELVYREKKEIEIAGRQITVFELSPFGREENITLDFPQSIYVTAQNGILGYAYSDSVEYLIINPIFK